MSESCGQSPGKFLPYGRQCIEQDDLDAVVAVLKSDWLTTGPEVDAFEADFATFTGSENAVALSSGTAALHAAYFACGVGLDDEVIVPSMTFAATANAALYLGGKPVFVDVDPETLLIDPNLIEAKITSKTKALVTMDYAGQPCSYDILRKIADRHQLVLIADACHAVGGSFRGQSVGTLADLNCFSFHPVKHITTAEGGMVTTSKKEWADRMRLFRNHGITTDHRQRAKTGSLRYEMVELGFNYRLSDLQCALGRTQLKKLANRVDRRIEIARLYDESFQEFDLCKPLSKNRDARHAYHLYVVQLNLEELTCSRDGVHLFLKETGIGTSAHYPPLHLHPYYRKRFGYKSGMLPVTESAFERALSLPMYPEMADGDVMRVVDSVKTVLSQCRRNA